MKTKTLTSLANGLEDVIIRARTNFVPFGAGYLQYLNVAASMDEEEPARRPMQQPVRYLTAVEPVGEPRGDSARQVSGLPSLREAVTALRQKILAS